MKRIFIGALPALLTQFTVGGKNANVAFIYGATALLSLVLLLGGFLLVKKNKGWFLFLYSSIFVVNLGYTLLSLSPSLEFALNANRISYLGSVLLPFTMLMIILKITNTRYRKPLPWILLGLAAGIFFLAASPGILPIYYKEVSFQIVNGSASLNKVYGPLHPLYLIYLLGYFGAMIAVTLRAVLKKTFDATSHAMILVVAVFVNLAVWFAEQVSPIDFEILSVSYIVSGGFLLLLQYIVNENQRLKEQIREKEKALRAAKQTGGPVSREALEIFAAGLKTLTPTEREVYEGYLAGETTKELMQRLNIKENTLKFHNKNLYGKLGISSRKQLLEIAASLPAPQTNPSKIR